MLAKFADIPSVILRTDFRGAGDQGAAGGEAAGGDAKGKKAAGSPDAWNLMSSFWPRTKVVRVDSMGGYKMNLAAVLAKAPHLGGVGGGNTAASTGLLDQVAREVVEAMEEVVRMEAVLPRELRASVYEWLQIMPGFKDGDLSEIRKILQGKLDRDVV